MLLEPAQIILSDKLNRILTEVVPWYTCHKLIIYIEEESYATKIGKVTNDTVKKYN